MSFVKPDRTAIWLRKPYIEFVEAGTITTIFRPERRLLPEGHEKALGVGETVDVVIVDKIGADWAEPVLYGELLPEPRRKAIITNVTVKTFSQIRPADFKGSTPDVHDRDSLQIHLGLIYNLAAKEFTSHLWVTITNFRYIDKYEPRP